MEMIFTNGRDPRFLAMCRELDTYLNDLVGGETQRSQYDQYNTPAKVTDVALLMDGDRAAACGGFKYYEAGTAEIKRVLTRPEYRKRGCARAVMDALETRAAAQGYSRLILETGRMMSPAIGLYTAIGFHRIENYGQYRDMPQSVCMEKLLISRP
jgi:putative acetyltransferase